MYVVRFLFLNKIDFNFLNSYNILKFEKIIAFFSVCNLEDFDNFCISNYFYFIFFFFGNRSFFFNYSTNFSLGIYYYNFTIRCILNNYRLFYVFNFLINETYGMYIYKEVYYNENRYFISNVNFFFEKRPNIGFFNLKHDFCLQYYYQSTWKNEQIIFSLFKLIN